MNTWQERPGGGAYGQGDAARGQGGPAAEPPLPPELNPRGAGVPLSRPAQQDRPTTGRPPGPGQGPGGQPPYGGGQPPHGGGGQPPYGRQPYGQQPSEPQRPGGAAPGTGPGARPRRSRKKVVGYSVLGLVLALLVTMVGTYFWADGKLHHENVLADYPGRPAAGKGTNWLIVGSDSRAGLTDADEQDLHTGSAEGKRSDSMMILHIGDNGNTLMSIPRDSWVQIPAHQDTSGSGKTVPAATHKINAAFAAGGGRLLVQTVETNMDLRIDHYAEIGFAGFVGLVDAVGGVEMTIDQPVKDKDSGLDLQAGTQTLNGKQALAFVRQRHQMADQDLGRMRNQQKFLGALAKQAASPTTLLNPFTFYPLVSAGLDTVIVDDDAGLTDLGSMFLAMKGVTGGDGKTITVPIGNPDYHTPTGESAVKWDPAKSKAVFDAMKNDTAVPDVK
ncbi:LCP family protein [Kitasatospora cineracea]|uniref:LytR family transcriptional attenuator n=1 Tax=Kitasatospora cineracea TaxID=88074 RepID=A0A3N4RTQ8_9ACTN|nr:LCP family protein [Kitasatospora cineracea]RPE34449.1 LytR family transcriptional attenuator [Kitasatospora cineracea]